ncbi:MAG: universal stress protein [Verrucomicrobiota bacterium]
MSGIALKRILVPVDFSESSLHAVRYARDFARHFDATILLLHAVEPPAAAAYDDSVRFHRYMEDVEETACRKLEQLADEELKGGQVLQFVRDGVPVKVITEVADEQHADVIIVATHGHSGLKHLLLGGVTEKVVRHAKCPVVVVR